MRRPLCVAAGLLGAGMAAVLWSECAARPRARTQAPRAADADADAGLEADVDLTDGPGAVAASFKLRDKTLTALLPRADDGAPAGLYRAVLDAGDPLLVGLAALPAAAGGRPPRPDVPAASFVVRSKASERRLVVARPASDPTVARVLAELERRQASMRARPLLTLRLEVRPPLGKTVTVRLLAEGAAGAEVRIAPDSLMLQAAAEPARAPGVTPLPPEWQIASEPSPETEARLLAAGSHLDLPLTAALPPSGTAWVRAVLDGMVGVRTSAAPEDVRMSLSSKPIPVGARKTEPRK